MKQFNNLRIALVHDYIREYGGAERVLEALTEAFPEAPIYTAFARKDSKAYEKFKDKKIIQSWAHWIPFFDTKLHSPLRFLAPLIWGSFDFSKYDVVVSSASWYVTKGFGGRRIGQNDSGQARMTNKDSSSLTQNDKNRKSIEFCYCHTPPRWLYGYRTSVEFQKYWPIKVYATIVGHFMRMYDFRQAQKVDYFIANSKEVQGRIKKFYRRESVVIYPPVSLPESRIMNQESRKKQDYYFMVSRLVGSKGLDLAVEAAHQTGIKLKIAGVSEGYSSVYKDLLKKTQSGSYSSNPSENLRVNSVRSSHSVRTVKSNVEFLGYVSDEELVRLYSEAKGFLALSTDEDFGITPVESMLCGTPVIAYNGGGYKETVVDGKTGVLFYQESVESLVEAIKKFEKTKFSSEVCQKQAEKFSKDRFIREIQNYIEKKLS